MAGYDHGVFYDAPNPAGVDAANIKAALRVTFIGAYNADEDDFTGNTCFTRSLTEEDTPTPFSKKDKQNCGFLLAIATNRFARAQPRTWEPPRHHTAAEGNPTADMGGDHWDAGLLQHGQ